MAMGFDELQIDIDETGLIRVLTSKVSAANHANSEEFLRYLARMGGGDQARQRRPDALHHHDHSHAHTAKEGA